MEINLDSILTTRDGTPIIGDDATLGGFMVGLLDAAPGIQSTTKKNACVRLATKIDRGGDLDFSEQERELMLLCVKNAPWNTGSGAYLQMKMQSLLGDDALGDSDKEMF